MGLAGIPYITCICKARVGAYETWPMSRWSCTQAWPCCGIASQLQERLSWECS
jgi:hypothetical protein